MYPNVKGQDDIMAIVREQYKHRTGRTLPACFIIKMLHYRRTTILRAVKYENVVKLDRLGKLLITSNSKDRKDIIESLGEGFTRDDFKNELKRRADNYELNCQKYSKITGAVKSSYVRQANTNKVIANMFQVVPNKVEEDDNII